MLQDGLMHSYRRRIRFTLAIDRILVLETGASVYVCVGVKFDIKRWRLLPLWVNFLCWQSGHSTQKSPNTQPSLCRFVLKAIEMPKTAILIWH